MADRYLDTTKSVIVSSPAGSGKTEKLARRYISLIREGAEVEKVLCITFTEKAAAEMKSRILGIMENEEPGLFEAVKPRVPLMRISTIHAFCLRLLRRFSLDLGLDPSLSVADELQARELWLEAVYESLRQERDSPSDFFRMTSRRGMRGWDSVKRALHELHYKRPYPEMMMAEGAAPEGEALEIFSLYGKCLDRYRAKKLERRMVDFQDLELLAYEALSRGAECLNILYAFDEHTDHVLVDEFQDTSSLQWKIIEKLTEEWRSGLGAKRDAGKTPTIFLVGDEKQSIYRFRGANVSVFQRAKENFAQWLGRQCYFIEARENYRSLPAIVDFVNELFEKLMPSELLKSWITRYTRFEATREGEGGVDLVLLEGGDNTKETRAREALALARTIRSLHGSYEVYGEDGQKRPCGYGDMAVLLRSRTHLGLFEEALRNEGIPFVMLKGIGFYDAPEVAALRELLCLIVDPTDGYCLFEVLRSPLFSIDHRTLTRLFRSRTPVIEKLGETDAHKLGDAPALLRKWIDAGRTSPLAVVLEQALTETRAWSKYWEKQRHANIKKFIGLIESYEAGGLTPLEIREKLLRQRFVTEVPKANINAEGMDAVRVLTIHSAKGLQFPMVFVPSLDESVRARTGPVVIDDEEGSIVFCYEEDSARRRKLEPFRLYMRKQEEEEKRLFYVALTRAMDYLCMLGSARDGKFAGRLGYLADAFGLTADGRQSGTALPFRIIREGDIGGRAERSRPELVDAGAFVDAPAYTEPLDYSPKPEWLDVTGDAEDTAVRKRHGQGWLVTGRVMHTVFEELSKGLLLEKDITERTDRLLRREGVVDGDIIKTVLGDVLKLKRVGLLDEIIMPRKNAYAELPFVLERGRRIYRGRIDRILLRPDRVVLYDYKTFPAGEDELEGLAEAYRPQMEIYREAASRLFGLRARSYLIFTHIPRVVEV